MIAGKTLNQAEAAISTEFGQALRRGRISISLLEPRKFRVHVTGEVLVPGSYTVPATARVRDAIEEAQGFRSVMKASAFGDSTWVPQVSLRRIQMRSSSGVAVNVDMQRFLQGGDLGGNPHLTDGAVVHVPPISESSERTGVFGAVYYEGSYEFAPGDDVGSLLSLAGGLTPSADSSSFVLQRENGERIPLSFSAADFARKIFPGDRVFVGGKPRYVNSGSASIRGQIAKPGGYSIVPGVTTVAELVEQAGGLLSDAASQSARLIRRKSPDSIAPERQRVLTAPGSVTAQEPVSLADKELAIEFLRWDYGTVVLDLSADPDDPDAAEHVTLQDGDVLEIPRQPMGVRVLGYVNHAGEVPWVEGGDLSHYIDAAGGMNRAGWKGRAIIIKARNGSQLRYHKNMEVNPGDVLFVPQRPRTTSWEKFKDIVSVVAQLATLALIIQNTSK
jgi:protein involved in polysaccharide export with SLBB domain